jgi:hypothetical protein
MICCAACCGLLSLRFRGSLLALLPLALAVGLLALAFRGGGWPICRA